MTRMVAIIQARMGASRLPGKSLMAIAGRPMIDHVLERAGEIVGLTEVVLATSQHEQDVPLANRAQSLGYRAWRCPLRMANGRNDVLSWYHHVAQETRADILVRLTGDCPLLAPEVCQRVVDAFVAHRRLDPWTVMHYAWNDTATTGYPDGTDCEVMTRAILDAAWTAATDHEDRHHVTPWIRRHQRVLTVTPEQKTAYPVVKLSVDTTEDLERVRAIFGYLAPGQFDLAATLRALTSASAGKGRG